jgi:hypothetical protein
MHPEQRLDLLEKKVYHGFFGKIFRGLPRLLYGLIPVFAAIYINERSEERMDERLFNLEKVSNIITPADSPARMRLVEQLREYHDIVADLEGYKHIPEVKEALDNQGSLLNQELVDSIRQSLGIEDAELFPQEEFEESID